MKSNTRIGIVADYDVNCPAHIAIPRAIERAAQVIGQIVEIEWLSTPSITADDAESLQRFDGIWCAPGSPYASMDGALTAIRFARENQIPFLGTCGGFQHALIEYWRNVLGKPEADHQESNPNTTMPVISRLDCSLAESIGRVLLLSDSSIRRIYGKYEVMEGFNCNYGVNARFESILDRSTMRIGATDERGRVRAVELDGHPFFIATLYQPERSIFRDESHPLIEAFVKAAESKCKIDNG